MTTFEMPCRIPHPPTRRLALTDTGLAEWWNSAAEPLLDTRGDFRSSYPAFVSKSQHLVDAVTSLSGSIGDFEILGLLGEGAFGKVFLARQISLDREVALKVTADWGHEGRTMALLEHSHVVPVFSELVDRERNLRLLCMKYIPGATLRQIIQHLSKRPRDEWSGSAILQAVDQLSSGPATLDPASLRDREVLGRCGISEAVCRIGQQLAETLEYAHGRGVLHRDIKPANVIVNQYGQPMLTDFSVSLGARAIANAGGALFGGTLGYMAPEHLAAIDPKNPTGPEVVGPRSDLYSLGALLLDLYTGGATKCPVWGVSGNTQHNATTADIDRPGEETIPRDGHGRRDLGEVADLLDRTLAPAPLARAIIRCLRPNAEDRFQSAAQLAGALSGCFRLLRIERDLPAAGRLTRWGFDRPLLFILLLTLVPSITASLLNITYNATVVIQELAPAQQTAFARMVLAYNVVAAILMAVLVERTLITVARSWRRLNDGNLTTADFDDLRLRTLRLPLWGVVLGVVGWIPFVLIIPGGMEAMAGPIDRGVLLHISLAFLVTGLIAINYCYYLHSFVVLRVMYPRLWMDALGLRESAAGELAAIPARNRLMQIAAGLTPLGAATILVVVGPDQFSVSSLYQFRATLLVLIGAGIAGFWLAMSGTALLNHCVAVYTALRHEE